jgi:hypothetical protein
VRAAEVLQQPAGAGGHLVGGVLSVVCCLPGMGARFWGCCSSLLLLLLLLVCVCCCNGAWDAACLVASSVGGGGLGFRCGAAGLPGSAQGRKGLASTSRERDGRWCCLSLWGCGLLFRSRLQGHVHYPPLCNQALPCFVFPLPEVCCRL